MDLVTQVASTNIHERRNAIMDILRKKDIPFALRRIKQNEHWVENIIISFAPSNKRLVIGAHYDNLENSSGANDNASGVSVLIKIAEFMHNKRTENVDIVFFDREEYGDHGSNAYIDEIGKENIAMMINLDTCGYGDAISIITKGNIGNPNLGCLLMPEMIEKHKIISIDRLPSRFGDDDTFDEYNIPNIAITVMPREEAIKYSLFINKVMQGIECTPEENESIQNLNYSKTMHNKELDSIESVSDKALRMVYSYLLDGLINI